MVKSGSENTGEIRGDTRFKAGNPGKPRGARNKATLAMQELLEGEGEKIARVAVDMALNGDMTAVRLCMERLVPARKSRPVSLDIPKIEKAEDVVQAMSAVVAAVADGEIDPDEGEAVARVLEVKRRSLETANLEERIKALENRKA